MQELSTSVATHVDGDDAVDLFLQRHPHKALAALELDALTAGVTL
jgi:hypothetical protein